MQDSFHKSTSRRTPYQKPSLVFKPVSTKPNEYETGVDSLKQSHVGLRNIKRNKEDIRNKNESNISKTDPNCIFSIKQQYPSQTNQHRKRILWTKNTSEVKLYLYHKLNLEQYIPIYILAGVGTTLYLCWIFFDCQGMPSNYFLFILSPIIK